MVMLVKFKKEPSYCQAAKMLNWCLAPMPMSEGKKASLTLWKQKTRQVKKDLIRGLVSRGNRL
jgi:hypothetical protein